LARVAARNLSVIMRALFKIGTPRGLQGHLAMLSASLLARLRVLSAILRLPLVAAGGRLVLPRTSIILSMVLQNRQICASSTGC
jgi:hypothetical protein